MFQILRFTERSYKSFNYFGINLKLPDGGIEYIATDSDGEVYGHFSKPSLRGNGYWVLRDDSILLGTIEFKGDFKDSLVEVKE